MTSPVIDASTATVDVEFSMYAKFEFDPLPWHGVIVEYSFDGSTWERLGEQGADWYNGSMAAGGGDAFIGENDTWTSYRHTIPDSAGESNLQVRLVLITDDFNLNFNGMAFDFVRIGTPGELEIRDEDDNFVPNDGVVDIGGQTVNDTVDVLVDALNVGGSEFDITDISEVTSSNADVGIGTTTPITIPGSGQEQVTLEIEPQSNGEFSAVFEFTVDDVWRTYVITIVGFGGRGLEVRDPDDEPISPADIYEPAARPPHAVQDALEYTFTIENIGTEDVAVDAIAVVDNSSALSNSSVAPNSFAGNDEIGVGTSVTFVFTATADVPGQFWAEFEITHNGGNIASPLEFRIEGIAALAGGTYTIDSDDPSAHFTDIGDAIRVIEDYGIAGPVEFDIFEGNGYDADSNYRFTEFHGASSTNTVTLQAAPGEHPVIRGTGVADSALLFIPAGGHVVIDGLVFDLEGENSAHALRMTGRNCANVTIRNNRIHNAGNSSYGIRFDTWGADATFEDITIKGNTIEDFGSSSRGISLNVSHFNGTYDDMLVTDNVVQDLGNSSIGIEFMAEGSLEGTRIGSVVIDRNELLALGNHTYGVRFHLQSGNEGILDARITRNRVVQPSTQPFNRGFDLQGASSEGIAGRLKVENNVVSGPLGNSWNNAILYLVDAGPATRVTHNTFAALKGRAVVSHWAEASDLRTASFENNIVYAGGESDAWASFSDVPEHIDGNLIHLGPGASLADGSEEFGDWQAAGRDVNGHLTEAHLRFVETGDLRPAANSPAIGAALPSGVSEDTEGTARPIGEGPDIGAYEFDPASEAHLALWRSGAAQIARGGEVEIAEPALAAGVTMPLTFTIRNQGGLELELTTPPVAEDGTENADVTGIVQPDSGTLAAADADTFTVEIEPNGNVGDEVEVTLLIDSDDPQGVFAFTITGEIVDPEGALLVEGPDGSPVEHLGETMIPAQGAVGTEHEAEFTVRNVGSAPVTLFASPELVELDPVLGIEENEMTLEQAPDDTIEPHTSTSFVVRYTPSLNEYRFDVYIDNDASPAPFHFRARGHIPSVIASDESIDFGTVEMFFSSRRELHIDNLGTTSLTIKDIYLSDPHSYFSVDNIDPAHLLVGGTGKVVLDPAGTGDDRMTLELRFVPESSGGPFDATLRIETDDPQTRWITVALTGRGDPQDDSGCAALPNRSDGGWTAPLALLLLALIGLAGLRRRG